jgi:hypothetical protein
MEFLKKVNALVLGLAVLLTVSCGVEEKKKEDPAPIEPTQETCQLTSAGSAVLLRYAYDSKGKVDSMYIRGSTYFKVIYNSAGNPTEIKSFDINNTPIALTTYSYNSNGILESRFSGPLPSDGYSNRNYKYYYNSANQLIKQTVHWKDTVTLEKITYSYPAPDQVISKGYSPATNGGGYPLYYTRHNYYDNMKNPTLLLGYLIDDPLSSHNVIRMITTEHPSNTTSTIDYTYVYNEAGFPVKRTRNGSPNYSWTYNCQ